MQTAVLRVYMWRLSIGNWGIEKTFQKTREGLFI